MSENHHLHGGRRRDYARQAGVAVDAILDFSANINPAGPPAWLADELTRHLDDLVHYPEAGADTFCEAVAHHLDISPAEVLAGNGANQLLYALPRALKPRRVLLPVPAYIDYRRAAVAAGLPVTTVQTSREQAFRVGAADVEAVLQPGDLVMVGHPSNPAGSLLDVTAWRALAARHPACRFVIDEAFLDFVTGATSFLDRRPENLVVVRSLTKFYAIPGLRLGYLVAAPDLAGEIRRQLPDWSVNTLAQAVGIRALADHVYQRHSRSFVAAARETFLRELQELPMVDVYPGAANFLLCRYQHLRQKAGDLAAELLQRHRLAVRTCESIEGLDAQDFRLAVRSPVENERLLAALRQVIA